MNAAEEYGGPIGLNDIELEPDEYGAQHRN